MGASRKLGSKRTSRPLLVRAPPNTRARLALARRLGARLGLRADLEITDNTYTMVSYSHAQEGFKVRLHRMFLEADEQIIDSVAGYILGEGRRASSTLDEFIHEHRHLIRTLTPRQRQRRLALKAKGRVHDLQGLLEEVRERWFADKANKVAIAWAPAPRVKLPRRSIKLGSYSADTQVIRIHPALDQGPVPAYFVQWIIFHELLHHVFRADLKARRRRVHTPEFCRLEREYPHYQEAIAWERRHLDLLLCWSPKI